MAQHFPQQFGQYTLQHLIARGGMAEIYRAAMPGIGGFEKAVVIKKILPHLTENDEFITMLIDEAQILVGLNHANIAQVYDLGIIDESYYIAMEYVHGLDISVAIKELQKRGQFIPFDHTAYIVSGLCMGLHVAHHATDSSGAPLNIVHRDISPHNVLISFAGDVKVIDFGVAKARSKNTHTKAGVIKGKLLYMAPEQAMAKEIDGRADLFAAGLVMYKMLTCELPFQGDNEFQIYNNILTKEIVPPKIINPAVPESLNQICMTLLQREPERRYQTGRDSKRELDRALHMLKPGYTPARLSRFIEEQFSHIVREREQKARPAPQPAQPATPRPAAPAPPSFGTQPSGQYPTHTPAPARPRYDSGSFSAQPRPPAQSYGGSLDFGGTPSPAFDLGQEGDDATVEVTSPFSRGAARAMERVRTDAAEPAAAQRTRPVSQFDTPVPGQGFGGPVATPANGFDASMSSTSQQFGTLMTVDAPAPAQPSKAKIQPLLIAIVALALIAVGLVAYMFIGGQEPAPAPTPPPATTTIAPKPAPTKPAAETKLPAVVNGMVAISLKTTPEGAAVFMGEDKLGVTPIERMKLPEEDFPIALELKRDGFMTESIELTIEKHDLTIELEQDRGEDTPLPEGAAAPEATEGEAAGTEATKPTTPPSSPKKVTQPAQKPTTKAPAKTTQPKKVTPSKKSSDDGWDIDFDATSPKKPTKKPAAKPKKKPVKAPAKKEPAKTAPDDLDLDW